MQMLTAESMRKTAPSIFAEGAHPKMSARYQHVTSSSVIDAFADHGYFPVTARQDRVNSRDPNFVRHEVKFRRESDIKNGVEAKVGEYVPQIMLVNSHNGRTKLRLFGGLYRFVCSNGLVIGNDKFRIELAHTGNLKQDIADCIGKFSAVMGEVNQQVEAWKVVNLSIHKAQEFAKAAGELRFGKDGLKAYNWEDFLKIKREADDGRSLWQTYNVLQENLTKGGLTGTNANGRAIRTREIVGIGSDLAFNDQLWNLAAQFA